MSTASGNTRLIHRLPLWAVEEICRYLLFISRRWSDTVGPRSVAALAATSRFFHEPALNVLWHTISDVSQLLFVLPKCAYNAVTLQEDGGIQPRSFVTFNGVPDEQQVKRLFTYASRVRVISSEASCPTASRNFKHTAAPAVYDTLAMLQESRGNPFTNLEQVTYHCPSELITGVFGSFHALFGPALRELLIWDLYEPHADTLTESADVYARMLGKVKDIAPSLRELSVNISPEFTSAVPAMLAVLHEATHHLVSVCLGDGIFPLTPAAVLHLARLPHLHTLEFSVDGTFFKHDLKPVNEAIRAREMLFPAIRELHISAPTFVQPRNLLRIFRSPHIEELDIRVRGEACRSDIDPLFIGIARMPAHKRISRLYIEALDIVSNELSNKPISPPPPDGEPAFHPVFRSVSGKTLAPLLSMSNLYDIVLKLHCPFAVEAKFLAKAASTWPRLDRLTLGSLDAGWWDFMVDSDRDDDEDKRKDDGPGADGGAPPENLAQANNGEHPGQQVEAENNNADGRGHDDGCVWKPYPRPATILGLLPFARHCSALDVLAVEFDARLIKADIPDRLERMPLPGEQPPRWPINGPTTLNVGMSPIDDPCAVAAFLSGVFPMVDEVLTGWEWAEEIEDIIPDATEAQRAAWPVLLSYKQRWEAVGQLIPMYVEIRKEERRWRREAAGLPPEELPHPYRRDHMVGDLGLEDLVLW